MERAEPHWVLLKSLHWSHGKPTAAEQAVEVIESMKDLHYE